MPGMRTSTACCSTTARTRGRAGWWRRTRGRTPREEPDLVAYDAGIDGGAASAEEAAVHVVDDVDTGIPSDD